MHSTSRSRDQDLIYHMNGFCPGTHVSEKLMISDQTCKTLLSFVSGMQMLMKTRPAKLMAANVQIAPWSPRGLFLIPVKVNPMTKLASHMMDRPRGNATLRTSVGRSSANTSQETEP